MTQYDELRNIPTEELMEKCLLKILEDIRLAEAKGKIHLRKAAIRAKVLAEATITEVQLRKVSGVSFFD